MVLDVCGVYWVEIPGLITSFWDGDGLTRPINDEVGGLELGESKDNIFPATRHDMEEVFLCDAFYVDKEGAGEVDFPIFVWGLVDVSYFDGDIKFCGGKGVFSNKLPVNARDVCATINQGMSVDNFQCVERDDEL